MATRRNSRRLCKKKPVPWKHVWDWDGVVLAEALADQRHWVNECIKIKLNEWHSVQNSHHWNKISSVRFDSVNHRINLSTGCNCNVYFLFIDLRHVCGNGAIDYGSNFGHVEQPQQTLPPSSMVHVSWSSSTAYAPYAYAWFRCVTRFLICTSTGPGADIDIDSSANAAT